MGHLVKVETQIAMLAEARRALASAKTIDVVKDIRDRAQAVQHYLKQRDLSFEAQQDAAEIKLRAERRLGEMLGESVEHKGGRRAAMSNKVLPEGVRRMDSHRWQRVASLPSREFENYLTATRTRGGELTTAGALKLAKAKVRESVNGAVETCTVVDLQKLVTAKKKFGTLCADPPWQYDNQATRAATDNHYPTMTVAEIAALPVADLAAKKSHLHLWVTDSFLEDGIALLKGWGFKRRQTFIWCKPQLGIGNYWRSNHEYMLLGVRGDLTFPDESAVKSYLEMPRTRHSTKPHAVRKLIERVSPTPRLELFGRECLDGWVVWGNQIERTMFDNDIKEL